MRLLGMLMGLVVLCGCGQSGPRRAEVAGSVKLNGQDVIEGAIQFIPIEGTKGPSAGAPIKDGKYHIARTGGVVVGKNRVELRATRKTGKKVQDPTAKPGTLVEEVGESFPGEYNIDSKMSRDVQEGSNTLDFEIQTKK